jgi:hypothetical protein
MAFKLFKLCNLTGQLCDKVKIVRKLKGCAVAEKFIKDMKGCPQGKEVRK